MSPRAYIPNSRTARSCSFVSCRSVSGMPISVCRLAALFSTLDLQPRTDAISSLQVVLPTLPVTAITLTSRRRRHHPARRCSAPTEPPTRTRGAAAHVRLPLVRYQRRLRRRDLKIRQRSLDDVLESRRRDHRAPRRSLRLIDLHKDGQHGVVEGGNAEE